MSVDIFSNVLTLGDFMADWMFNAIEPIILSNAMLHSFLMNRGLIEFNERDGYSFDFDGNGREHGDLRRLYYSMMESQLYSHNKYGLLLISPFKPITGEEFPIRLSCHCLTLISGDPKKTAKQLAKAITRFRYSDMWSYWVRRRGDPLITYSVPLHMIVFEIDNFARISRNDVTERQKKWFNDVALNLGKKFGRSNTFPLRFYLLTNFTMELIHGKLFLSSKPFMMPLALSWDADADYSCTDSSDYDEGAEERACFYESLC